MIPPTRIAEILQLEPIFVLAAIGASAWIFYKVFLRSINGDRHRLLGRLFKNAWGHGAAVLFFFVVYKLLFNSVDEDLTLGSEVAAKLYPFAGFFCIISGAIFFVKISRIIAFEYLFRISMKAGVPVLLVNILSLGISLGLAGWTATEVFQVRLAPVLATSGIIAVILGLAMQDTLGNLFAGIALQFDKPFEIGDWIKVQNDGMEWIGQVDEISWRSTFLVGLLEESITIPNRVIAQSEVAAYGHRGKYFLRGINFHIPLDAPFARAKEVMTQAVKSVKGLPTSSEPQVYFNEVGDSWINLRLLLPLTDYGSQIGIVDRVHVAVFEAFAREGLQVSAPLTRVDIINGAADRAGHTTRRA